MTPQARDATIQYFSMAEYFLGMFAFLTLTFSE